MATVVLDIETNGIHDPDKLWCIVVKNLDDNKVYAWHGDDEWDEFIVYAKRFTTVIGHNIIHYDLHHLKRLIGWDYTGRVVDTLVLSHLLKYDMDGGHSLDAWGTRLKYPKQEFSDFSKFSETMLEYCVNDVNLNHKLYDFLTSKLDPKHFAKAIEVECEVAKILRETQAHGFPFDIDKMNILRKEIEERVNELDGNILKHFPPRTFSMGEYMPKLTKHGTISRANLRWYDGTDFSVFSDGAPFSRLGVEPFNPGSVKQIVTRLTDNEWWQPVERTNGYIEAQRNRGSRSASEDERQAAKDKMAKLDKYGWKLSETNLSTLKDEAPEPAKSLVERLALGNRLSTFNSWESAYNPTTKAIHGTINTIGTWTHRCSHTHPNLANIAAKKSIKYKEVTLAKKITELGGRMRDLFHCGGTDSQHWLVGTDAEGIQLRLFSHYANDEALIKANVEGNKELGTDIHSLNRMALGPVCRTRDDAKTWIYAYLLGAGQAKLASILGCSAKESNQALGRLLETYQSIAELRNNVIPKDAARGYFVGIDGRLVVCNSEHLMLAGYLQNGEVLVMKHAMVAWHKEADKLGLQYRLANFVHDEWQTIVRGPREEAEEMARIQRASIEMAGRELGVRCPLAGASVIGKTWLDTH